VNGTAASLDVSHGRACGPAPALASMRLHTYPEVIVATTQDALQVSALAPIGTRAGVVSGA
jgi:hypothetical protein